MASLLIRRGALIASASIVVAIACSTPYREDARKLDPRTADAEADRDAGVDATDSCDQDGDGFRAANAICGGDDCDDEDARAHPNAGFVAAVPPASTNGDWDCNGVIEKQYAANVDCFSVSVFAPCNKVSGFMGDPACGESGAFVQCDFGGGSRCAEGKLETRSQTCR